MLFGRIIGFSDDMVEILWEDNDFTQFVSETNRIYFKHIEPLEIEKQIVLDSEVEDDYRMIQNYNPHRIDKIKEKKQMEEFVDWLEKEFPGDI